MDPRTDYATSAKRVLEMICKCGPIVPDLNAAAHAVEFAEQEYYCPHAVYRSPNAWWYLVVWVIVKRLGRPLVDRHWLDK